MPRAKKVVEEKKPAEVVPEQPIDSTPVTATNERVKTAKLEGEGTIDKKTGEVTGEVRVTSENVTLPKPLYYEGKLVIGVQNKIIGGRIYKEIETGASRFTLSQEEFIRDVKHG